MDELGVLHIHYLKAGGSFSILIGYKPRILSQLKFSLAHITESCNTDFQITEITRSMK